MTHPMIVPVRLAVIALVLLLGWAVPTATQGRPADGTWLAAAETSGSSSVWGRLRLKDGVLSFATSRDTWSKALNEIRRVTAVDGSLIIEAYNGDVLRVSILGQQMLRESPRKALKLIERAVRDAPAGRTVVVASAGSGSGY